MFFNRKREKEKLNIRSDSKDWRGEILSNLSSTPFKYGEYKFICVEAALQGIKFEDIKKREEIYKMTGKEALKVGREITESITEGGKHYVYWNDKKMEYGSTNHRLLIAMFIREKVRQNQKVQEALLATTDNFIYHDVGEENPNTSLPEKIYVEILLSERNVLKRIMEI